MTCPAPEAPDARGTLGTPGTPGKAGEAWLAGAVRRARALVRRLAPAITLALPLQPGVASAQPPLVYRLNTLQHVPTLAWHRIDTPHFTVIFPESLGGEAQRVARLLEANYQPLAASLAVQPPRIPVILNSQSMTSNAYVAWAPRRSQWYPMPNTTVDGFGPMEWYTLLAKHEGRHVVQERAVRSGWIGLAGKLFGDNTVAFLGASLYFPAWFWEGDAVGTETALSTFGRGRQPSFAARIRAMAADSQRYDYYPAWQGSYRTAFPDWYEQGYLLTSYVRRHHGDSAWRRIIKRASWNPLAPFALSMALKKETGLSLTGLHRAAVTEAATLWQRQRDAITQTPATRVTGARPGWRSWQLPQYAGDGSIIACYADLDHVPQLVRLHRDGRSEVLLNRIGIVGELQFHVRGGQVVWAEYAADPRYGERNYLVIKRMDLRTRKVRQLTSRSRYFGPALSPDGTRIAVVAFDESRHANLVILDATNGSPVQSIPNSGGFLVTPAWAPDGQSLYVVRVDDTRGNALVRVPLTGASERVVIDWTTQAISRPVPVGDRVYFGSPRSGLDNVWAVDTATMAVSQVTSRKFGAMFPAVSADGRTMLFSDYGPGGTDVAEAMLDPSTFVGESRTVADRVIYADSTIAQEARLGAQRDTGSAPTPRDYAPRPYGGLARVFDFHSLGIAPTTDGVNNGLAVESRNLLNTVGLNAGVVFNTNERTFAFEGGMSYAGLPLIIDAGARLGSRVSDFVDTSNVRRNYTWDERSFGLVARLPLTRLFGLHRQSVTASFGVARTVIRNQPVAFRFENNNGTFLPLSYAITASHVNAAATRDLFQTGASVSGVYRHTPGSPQYTGHVAAVRGVAITPGLFTNHNLVLDVGHEEQRPGNYRFSSELTFPRGFTRRYHDRISRAGLSYHLPLLYPDLALGPVVYARRIQGAVFADVARGSDRLNTRVLDYRSIGGELTADVAPLGTRSTMRVGVRVSQRLTLDKKAVAELILSLPQ